ncbi:MAG TPA: hypothetical protein VMY05_12125 [Acidobacteriota bacterium]|nr:hypothetical protein [Acidobacteriota bacterium]
MNRKVLLICYYFPPLGLGGVGRPLNLFKKLPACGWDCDVLTVKPVAYRAYEPELLDGVDTKDVHRSGSRDPQRLLYLAGVRRVGDSAADRARKVSARFFPDSKIGWVKPAVRLGRKLVRQNRYHALLSTSPPVSAHLVARQLRSDAGLPWVADFRDFWTSYKVEDTFDEPSLVTRGKQLLAAIVDEATEITTVNQAVSEYLGCGRVVTNGYDADLAANWQPPADADQFVIGLLGSFSAEVPVAPLFRALSCLREVSPSEFDKLRLLQVGQVDPDWFAAQLKEYALHERCDVKLLQGRKETIRLLSATSLMYTATSVGEAKILPSRVFDLLASGRPILACAPGDSEVGRLIEATGSGACFDESSLGRAVDFLTEIIRARETGGRDITPLPDYARKYSSEEMAGSFASILDNLP